MNKNYAVFPCKNVMITQNYNGTYSHSTQSSSTNGVKSYPIDICYGDTYLMAPCKMKSVKMNGFWDDAYANVVNQVFFQSTDKVHLANGEYDYITILATHMDDWDYDSSLIGKVYERGENMVNQGTDGGVGAHLDIVVGVGQTSWWVINSYGEWVLPNSRKPEEVFYIDPKYNNVIDTCGIAFKNIPNDAYFNAPKVVERDNNKRQFQVDYDDNLRIRETPNGNIIGILNKGIYDFIETKENGGYIWVNLGNCWCACTDMSRILEIVKEEPKVEEPKQEKYEKEEPKKDDINGVIEMEKNDKIKKVSKYVTNSLGIIGAIITGLNSIDGITIPYTQQIIEVIVFIQGLIGTYLLGGKAVNKIGDTNGKL